MWPVWQCIFLCEQFTETFKNTPWRNDDEKTDECNQCDYASRNVGNLRAHMKTHTGKVKQTNETSVIISLWFEDSSKITKDKSPPNVTSVTLPPF